MKIAINGSLGSGKSTVARMLADRLGCRYVSTGAWFREMALARGVTVGELNVMAENDASIDEHIDSRLKALNDSDESWVIDSRMAPFFIRGAVRIRLSVSDEEGARRIYADAARGVTECFSSCGEALVGYRQRARSELARYKEIYGVDISDETHYDLVIDTSHLNQEEVLDEILAYLQPR